ncbi:MAG: methyl-accepting chemotaxis protein [Leptospirales bacterium]
MEVSLKYDSLNGDNEPVQAVENSFKDAIIIFFTSPFTTIPLLFLSVAAAGVATNYHPLSGALLFPTLILIFLYRNPILIYLTSSIAISLYIFLIFYFPLPPETVFSFQVYAGSIMALAALLHLILHTFSLQKSILPNETVVTEEKEILPRHKFEKSIPIAHAMFLDTIVNIVHSGTGNIDSLASTNAGRLREQISSSHDILFTSQDMAEFFNDVDKKVSIIKSMSEKAIESAALGQKMALSTESEIKTVLNTMATTTDLIRNLSTSTNKIATIIDGIENVADQTNLLALNATIESARAGEKGHSFAVVAEEIGKLADTTQKSTRKVIEMINSIRVSTEATMDMLPKELQQANTIIDHSDRVHDLLENVLGDVEGLTDRVHELAIVSRKQSKRSNEIHNYVETISKFVSDNADGVKTIFSNTDNLVEQTYSLSIITDKFNFEERLENPLQRMLQLGNQFLEEISKVFESEMDKKHITEEELFNRTYVKFGDFNPPKYHSSFDRFTDEYLGPKQEVFLNKDDRLDYFCLVDDHGYVPTHNKKYMQTQTQNADDELRYNRTKRIYNDSIGIRASKNLEPYLLQMYKKDTGEFLNDLSMPFKFKDKHWGAVRIGYIF